MKTKISILLFLLFSFTELFFPQQASVVESLQQYNLFSGSYDGAKLNNPKEFYSKVISFPEAISLRLIFSSANLGKGSYLIIRSLKDSSWQKLNSVSINQWNYSSAYFNGNTVNISLFVSPGDKNIFFNISQLLVGKVSNNIKDKSISKTSSSAPDNTEDLCGADNRVQSNGAAVCRIIIQPNGLYGTGSILFNGKIATAGHVVSGIDKGSVIQFNVPLSQSDGTSNNPSANDQYTINRFNIISHNNGLGDDWAIISVYPNSNTGLMPKEAQNSFYYVEQNNSFQNARVTGYGQANGVLNHVQQSSTGINEGSSGNIVKYNADTQADNSGSPVIDEANGYIVGIHTNATCGSLGYNQGTSMLNSSLWNAINPVFSLAVDQKLESSAEMTGTYISRWIGNNSSGSFQNYPVNSTGASIDNVIYGSYETLRGKQDLTTVSPIEKYNRWVINGSDDQDITNHQSFLISTDLSNLTSQFKHTYDGVTLNNVYPEVPGLDPSSDVIEFKDPWLIDYPDPNYNGGPYKNRGLNSAIFKSQSAPFYPNFNSYYGSDQYLGVFLNQDQSLGMVNYSIRSPIQQPQDIYLSQTGRYHKFYFTNWSSTGTDPLTQNNIVNGYYESPVVFRSSNAVVTANLKGAQLSNNSSAYSNNSQRKFVRTVNGNLHMVYESLGHVWYEISSDSGRTWTIANNNKPLDAYGGKLPAIDCSGDNKVVIVWEENNDGALQLKIAYFHAQSIFPGYPLIAFDDIEQSYSQNLNPVIAYDYKSQAVIAWENKGNSVYPIGIVWAHGTVPTTINFQQSQQNPYVWLTDYNGTISTTDINCTNPTISAAKNPTDQINMIYGLAWQYNQSATSSYIHYRKLTFNSGGVSLSSDTNISSGDGLPLNYKPSIIAVQNGTARVCWIGANTNTSIYETVFRDPDNYRFWLFSYKVASVSINATDDNSAYYVAWSRNATGNNYVNQYTDSGTLSHISTANSTGQDIQLCNGYNKSSTYFCSFSPNTLPYTFTTSNSLNNFPKINPNGINSGRGSVISKRGAQFFYSFGDLTIDNNNIDFIKAPDTVNYNTPDKINNVLVTNPFTINNNSAIVFNECSGVIDSLTALSVLGDTGYVSFKSELIDNSTNNVIGTIRDSRLNAGELHDYNIASFNLNTDGLNGKTVKVKVTISTNIDSINSALTEHYADGSTMGKATVKSITLQKPGVITEYALGQNYPNPFNPTTVINYQLPKDGLVTIKIYDVLGNEIRTLVNENRITGKYSVSFDGSKLASGVYFYQLRVSGGGSNFVSTKKMLLIK